MTKLEIQSLHKKINVPRSLLDDSKSKQLQRYGNVQPMGKITEQNNEMVTYRAKNEW